MRSIGCSAKCDRRFSEVALGIDAIQVAVPIRLQITAAALTADPIRLPDLRTVGAAEHREGWRQLETKNKLTRMLRSFRPP